MGRDTLHYTKLLQPGFEIECHQAVGQSPVPAGLLSALPSAPCALPAPIPVGSILCYYIIYSFELEDDVCSMFYEFFIKTEKQTNLVSFESWWWVMALI